MSYNNLLRNDNLIGEHTRNWKFASLFTSKKALVMSARCCSLWDSRKSCHANTQRMEMSATPFRPAAVDTLCIRWLSPSAFRSPSISMPYFLDGSSAFKRWTGCSWCPFVRLILILESTLFICNMGALLSPMALSYLGARIRVSHCATFVGIALDCCRVRYRAGSGSVEVRHSTSNGISLKHARWIPPRA